MKKNLALLLVIVSIFFVQNIYAQTSSQIAFVNSDEVLESMNEKKKAETELLDLNKKYKDELQLMQNDYNKKYSDFISYQTSMAENIRLRRMQELYELEQHINSFMEVAQKDVLEREQQLLKPLRTKIKQAIQEVGVEGSYVCIYDLSNPTILFVTPDAVDVTTLVKMKLKIR